MVEEECKQAIANFEYLTDYRLLVCKEHEYAVRNLKTHLRLQHTYSTTVKTAVIQHFQGHEIRNPEGVVVPPEMVASVAALGMPKCGYLCATAHCGFISVDRKNIATHCRKEHDWKSTGDDRQHWVDIRVQTFCRTPGRQRYFQVRHTDDTTATTEETGEVMEEYQRLQTKRKIEEEVLAGKMEPTDMTGWWKRSGYRDHFEKKNIQHLAWGMRMPGKDEPELMTIGKQIREWMEEAVKGLSTMPDGIRRWLRGAKLDTPDVRPFARLQKEESQLRYGDYWIQVICYCIRVWQADQSEEDKGKMFDACTLFPWDDDLKEAVAMVWQVPCESTILHLSQALVFKKLYDAKFGCALIHIMAVLSIDRENNRLKEGNEYSFVIAGLMYMIRLVAAEARLPHRLRATQGEAEYEAFLTVRAEYLADGSRSVVGDVLSLLAYAKHIAKHHLNHGTAKWTDGGRGVQIGSRRFKVQAFADMVQGVMQAIEDLLWADLMWVDKKDDRWVMDLEAIQDDMSFKKRGWYFGADCKLEEKGMEWMSGQSREGRRMKQKGKWQAILVRSYLAKVDRFQKLLLFCVHLMSGQPARGTEITSLRFRNGVGNARNVFVLDGRVMTVTSYHKSQSQLDKPKIVPRFLPWRLGQVMVIYLLYVRTFAEFLRMQINEEKARWSDYIWADEEGRPWETSKLTDMIKRETGKRLGAVLTTQSYRHCAVWLGRAFAGSKFDSGFEEDLDEEEEAQMDDEQGNPVELQRAGGFLTGAGYYAVSANILKGLNQQSIDIFGDMTESWHDFLGLAHRDPSKKRGAREEWSRVKRHQRVDLRAFVEQNERYQKEILELKGRLMVTPRSMAGEDGLMIGWTPESMRAGPSSSQMESPLIDKAWRWTNMREIGQSWPRPTIKKKEDAIRKALGLDRDQAITYRSDEQEKALDRIMEGDFSVLTVILPTAGGKSLLFTAPACLEDEAGVTIVVVPYRKLVDETVVGGMMASKDCVEWNHGTMDPYSLVIVSADKVGEGFYIYARRMYDLGRLRRIVVDECHLLVTAHSWRPVLTELEKLKSVGVSMVMLTATLPVSMEADLRRCLGVGVGAMSLIRGSVVRHHIRYRVREDIEDGELEEETIRVWREVAGELRASAGEKVVIYCRSKAKCESLASQIGCGYFHASNTDKDEMLEEWKKLGGCMVATAALGTGVNYAGIKAVIHSGLPYGLISFAQESGRAGRGGEAVDSIILLEKGWWEEEVRKRRRWNEALTEDDQAMIDFVQIEGCRRLVLGRYFDRAAVTTEEGCLGHHFGEEEKYEMAACDRCGGGMAEAGMDRLQEAASEKEMVERALDEMMIGCAICWMRNRVYDGYLGHKTQNCQSKPMAKDGDHVIDMDKFRRFMKYTNDSRTCHKCGISQKLCRTRQDAREKCQWSGVAMAILMIAIEDPIGRNIINKAGFDAKRVREDGFEGWEAFGLWCSQVYPKRIWGEMMSNSMEVMKEFIIYKTQDREGGRSEGDVTDTEGGIIEGDTDIEGDLINGEGDTDIEGDLINGEGDTDIEGDLVEGDTDIEGDLINGEADITNMEEDVSEEEDVEEDDCPEKQGRIVREMECRRIGSKEEFWEVLGRYKGRCGFCMARYRVEAVSHTSWQDCDEVKTRDLTGSMQGIQQGLQGMESSKLNGCYRCWSPALFCGGKRVGSQGLLKDKRWAGWEHAEGWCGEPFGSWQECREIICEAGIGVMFSGREEVLDWLMNGQCNKGLEEREGGSALAAWWVEASREGIEIEWGLRNWSGEVERAFTRCNRLCEIIWMWG